MQVTMRKYCIRFILFVLSFLSAFQNNNVKLQLSLRPFCNNIIYASNRKYYFILNIKNISNEEVYIDTRLSLTPTPLGWFTITNIKNDEINYRGFAGQLWPAGYNDVILLSPNDEYETVISLYLSDYAFKYPGIYKLRYTYYCANKTMYNAFENGWPDYNPKLFFPKEKLFQGTAESNSIRIFVWPMKNKLKNK